MLTLIGAACFLASGIIVGSQLGTSAPLDLNVATLICTLLGVGGGSSLYLGAGGR